MSKCDLAYVLQAKDDTGYVKVGMTSDVERRVRQLRTSLPFTLEVVAVLGNGKAIEAEMKSLLSPWQTRGEWFHPRPELNEFLATKRRHNLVLERVEVDEAYCAAFITPIVLGYLAGREPAMNYAGDLVARYLRDGARVLEGRATDLIAAVKGEIKPEMIAGYVPLPEGAPTPCIWLPGVNASSKETEAA